MNPLDALIREPEMSVHGLPGSLVTLDGIDGSGKSTIVGRMYDTLDELGIAYQRVKLPSPECRRLPYIAGYILDHRQAEAGDVDLLSLCLVFAGDSLLTMRREVLPALARGTWVVCDRYVFGGLAELIATRRPESEIAVVSHVLSAFPRPDLAILTDIDAVESARRIHERPEERDVPIDADLWARFVEGYRAVGRTRGMHVVDTSRPVDECVEDVEAQVRALAARRGSRPATDGAA